MLLPRPGCPSLHDSDISQKILRQFVTLLKILPAVEEAANLTPRASGRFDNYVQDVFVVQHGVEGRDVLVQYLLNLLLRLIALLF